MDKSGSRYSSLNLIPPIIERPDLQTGRQRTVTSVLTAAFWAFWFYLWMPLLALLAWVLGVQQAHKYMVALEGYQELLYVLQLYAIVIAIMGGSLMIWAGYNIRRFSGADKRSARPSVTAADIGRDVEHDARHISIWQRARSLIVRYDDAGRLATVRQVAH